VIELIRPDWPAPSIVRAVSTTRVGGVSVRPYHSLNLGIHVGDDPGAVTENRRLLRAALPSEPAWLQQVHGTQVLALDGRAFAAPPEADAAWTSRPGVVCTVMTADCLPVLFCDQAGTAVAAAHAGWRGLASGVLEATVEAMGVPPERLIAWMGPGIGPTAFEVGDEVRTAFVADDPRDASAFLPGAAPGKWFADIFRLARHRLARIGVTRVHGGDVCTVSDPGRFFSHRRDRVSGRQATLVWLDPA
jgi:YfiH family protein